MNFMKVMKRTDGDSDLQCQGVQITIKVIYSEAPCLCPLLLPSGSRPNVVRGLHRFGTTCLNA